MSTTDEIEPMKNSRHDSELSLLPTPQMSDADVREVREVNVSNTTNVRTVVRLGVAFFFLFAAYNSAQNLVTSLLPNGLGFVSLCVIYSAVCTMKPFVPLLLTRLDLRWAMSGGALLYATYLGSLIQINYWAVCVTAGLLGIGGAVLWTAQGAFLTSLSRNEDRGKNVGLFWGIFSTSGIVGNLAAFFVLHYTKINPSYLMIGFTVLAVIGAIVLATLRKPHESIVVDGAAIDVEPSINNSTTTADADGTPQIVDTTPLIGTTGAATRLSGWPGVKALLTLKQTWLLLPLQLLIGSDLSYNVGLFPTLLPDQTYIGLVMMVTGFAQVAGGTLWGRLSDRMDRRLILAMGVFIYLLALGVSWVFHLGVIGELAGMAAAIPILPYFIAFFLALGDSCFNVTYLNVTGTAFEAHQSTMAFAFFQFFQSASAAATFLLGYYFGVTGREGSMIVPMMVACIAVLTLVAFCFAPLYARSALESRR
jgi:MFS family permease